ncbi:TraI/MobA(P) family conjugative relaxase [Methylotetracoccus oryzae]|uniref:TraI/MobA(P) family conjugative relaxase n=1 Tax=Methylotetracoccus oryzae TaxID=1919059 RepID=UPI0011194530|nr:TraI/MobA(P) family conjugative relaxase [Methylotetracoccus oryzae]
MIAKKVRMRAQRKSSMAGLIDYLTDEQTVGDPEDLVGYMTNGQGLAERVGAVRITNCQAVDATWAAAEMKAVQALNQRARSDKTYHMIISFREGEQPDSAVLQAIEDRLCEALGFGEHQRISVVHHDTDNLHLHVAINKIHPRTHTLHEPYYDHRTRAKVCAELEVEFGLQRDPHTAQQSTAAAHGNDLTAHTGVASLLDWIKTQCQAELEQAPTWTAFQEVLQQNDLSFRLRGNGAVFVAGDGTQCKASSVSRTLSLPGLEARLGPRPEVTPGTTVVPTARSYRRRTPPEQTQLTALYAAFLAERNAARRRKTELRRAAKVLCERRIAEARRQARLRRAAVKLLGRGLAATVAYQTIRSQLHREIQQAKTAYSEARKQLQAEHPLHSWKQWLKLQARRRAVVTTSQRPGLERSVDRMRTPSLGAASTSPGHRARSRDSARDDEERGR